MAKITVHGGPSTIDPQTGEPVHGPEGLVVEPEADEQAEQLDAGTEPAQDARTDSEPGDGTTLGYDPGAHTVQQVLDHLAEVDAQERARILAMEAAPEGKSRTGILTSAYAQQATEPDQQQGEQGDSSTYTIEE